MAKPTVSSSKAKKILSDGKVRGKDLSPKQKRFFGAVAGGAKMKKAKDGALVTKATNGDEVAEGEPTARRQKQTSAKTLILQGMQEGGMVEMGNAPNGLGSLAPVFEKYGEAGLNALRLGMASATALYKASRDTSPEGVLRDARMGGKPGGLDFHSLLQKEVAKAFSAISQSLISPPTGPPASPVQGAPARANQMFPGP